MISFRGDDFALIVIMDVALVTTTGTAYGYIYIYIYIYIYPKETTQPLNHCNTSSSVVLIPQLGEFCL